MYATAERRLRDCRDSSYFLRFGKNYTSQGGEDGILEQLFTLVGTASKPYCVEIGAWDGQHLSNTFRLVHDKEWGALLVEANSERCNAMRSLYNGRLDVHCVDCLVDIGGPNSLPNLLSKYEIPFDFDFVSIDVDGADYHLWHSIGESHRPRVVCIEFNPTIPNHVYFIQERDITIQEGSSLLAITELGRSLGYHLVVTTTFNALFVRMDLMNRLPAGIIPYVPQLAVPTDSNNKNDSNTEMSLNVYPTEYSLERKVDLNALHNGSMVTDIFQTYSGELKLCGPKKLLWHRVSMNVQQMQAIKPKRDRVFPFAPPYTKTVSSLEENMNNVTVVLVGLMACNSSESINSAQIPHLESGFNSLVRECMDVYGISDSKTAKKPLQSICQDIVMNTVAMCMITYQHLVSITFTATVPGTGTSNNLADSIGTTAVDRPASAQLSEPTESAQYGYFTLALLHMFISNMALSFEIIGDSAVDHLESGGSATTSVHLAEGKLWLQRAFYLMLYLQDHPCPSSHHLVTTFTARTVSEEVVTAALSRLSRKISTCCLYSASHTLPWKDLLSSFPAAAQQGQSQGNSFISSEEHVLGEASCSPATDVDEMLQGLYWKHLAATTSGHSDIPALELVADEPASTSALLSSASTTAAIATANKEEKEEEALKLNKLGKKWHGKLHWSETNVNNSAAEEAAQCALLAPVVTTKGQFPSNSAVAPTSITGSVHAGRLAVVVDSLGVLLNSCWSNMRFFSHDAQLPDDSATAHTATASLLLKLANVESKSLDNGDQGLHNSSVVLVAACIGIGFAAGFVAGAFVIHKLVAK